MSKISALSYLNAHVIQFEGDECLIWPFNTKAKRRPVFRIKKKGHNVCRYICDKIYGPAPSMAHQAAHSCGNGHIGCVNPKHLRWATPSENQQDRVIHGTSNHGERNGYSRISDEVVQTIRDLHRTIANKEIAKRFGISPHTVWAIASGYRRSIATGGNRNA
ncbi:transposase family protein [Rhizobium sp. RHZ02]|uniref:transposase family protein n=1 Tax=Rhizobium sp. RHZ02 TaxID=2769306 RepID=UPI00177FD52B|nr:transposase family protein [Rhizobium sp. RHZ02]MBD9453282.1 transposase family protein [Rhizobium sp. RHZ02]